MEGVSLNGIFMINITGCDSCPFYALETKLCRLIKLDTDETQTIEIGQGRIKIGCPFHSSDLIGIHLNREYSVIDFIQRNMN